jgi:hypothetical protein
MGRLTKYRPVPDQSYDPRVTDLSRPLNVPGMTGPQSGIPYLDSSGAPTTGSAQNPNSAGMGWTNRNVTNQIPFLLTAGISTRALPYNAKRTGLVIQNLDAAQPLSYSFSNDLQALGLQIGAGGAALFDFTTPPDTLYLFCGAANIQVAVVEISRAG